MNIKTGKILCQSLDKDGYVVYKIPNRCGLIKTQKGHRLVARVFIPNPNNNPAVNHINGIKNDNSVSNLEWVTVKENNIHADSNKLRDIRGERNGNNIIEDDVIHLICSLLESGATNKQIIDILDEPFKLCSTYMSNQSLISSIRHRKTWTHISNKYNY